MHILLKCQAYLDSSMIYIEARNSSIFDFINIMKENSLNHVELAKLYLVNI